MKCTACDVGLCYGSFEYRNKCTGRKEGISCACKCRITEFADGFTKTVSFIGGAACATGGFLTLPVPPISGFLFGTASSLMSKPIRKEISGEQLEFDDSVSEALTLGMIGASVGSGIGLIAGAATAAETAIAVATLTGAAKLGADLFKNNKT
ncbi:uncharacterized protein [Chironomus tepperi]|uniref:uncharacterized protein n=1 Tax=Chironomus tepperi TaxID=113505 RepID=UPI00391F4F27